jgi:DnaK suppressor protein
MSDRKDIDLDGMKTRMNARRDELRTLVDAHHDDAKPVEYDHTQVGRLSRMDEIQNQAMSAETERRRLDELHRIDAALARMAEDEYGYCATCGDEIEKKRLELDPAILTCIGCAR